MPEHKASINIKAVKTNSEMHNNREAKLDYIEPILSKNNEHWQADSISDRRAEIESSCKKISGRKMQKNGTPIREGVVNIKSTTTMVDLQKLNQELKKQFKIEAFQIHIHRDEGGNKEKGHINHHAHMVFDWQDKDTGKVRRLNKLQMSKMQDTVADTLEMERGKLGSEAVRLEAQAYKKSEDLKQLNKKLVIKKSSLEQLNSSINLPEKDKKKLKELNKKLERETKVTKDLDKKLGNQKTGNQKLTGKSQEQKLKLTIANERTKLRKSESTEKLNANEKVLTKQNEKLNKFKTKLQPLTQKRTKLLAEKLKPYKEKLKSLKQKLQMLKSWLKTKKQQVLNRSKKQNKTPSRGR